MKIKRLLIPALVAFCCLPSFSYPPSHKAAWLVGTWVNHRPNGDIYENWIKTGDMELTGKSYKLRGGDTVLLETIHLIQKDNVLFFIPVVTDQNGGKPVRFQEIPGKADKLLFENKQHDFPQFISYRKITTDSLVAEISGNQKGKFQNQIFPMKRLH